MLGTLKFVKARKYDDDDDEGEEGRRITFSPFSLKAFSYFHTERKYYGEKWVQLFAEMEILLLVKCFQRKMFSAIFSFILSIFLSTAID